jgi:hypothetical protein
VSLDALNGAAAHAADPNRNPFRFGVRRAEFRPNPIEEVREPTLVTQAPVPSAPVETPMPWKLTAVVQRGQTRWAVFSDCRGIPVTLSEGASLAGQWHVTRIGIESVTLRSLDNRPTTLPLLGCQP